MVVRHKLALVLGLELVLQVVVHGLVVELAHNLALERPVVNMACNLEVCIVGF